jgi:hypothetical protein
MSLDLTDLHTLIVRAHDRHKIPMGKAMRVILQAAANGKFPLYKKDGSPFELNQADRDWLCDLAAIAEQQNEVRWWEKDRRWLGLQSVLASEPKFWKWFNGEIGAPKTATAQTVPLNRSRNKRDRARKAIDALWPDGVPNQSILDNGQLCGQVTIWLKKETARQRLQYVPISDDTILRAAGRRPD